jgi:myo-inositol-1(or 4)-monophosphatase
MNWAPILKTAQRAAEEAGRLLLKHYGKLKFSEISQKSKNDFVTKVDKLSEKAIIKRIRQKYPRHSIQAEESGFSAGDNTCWVIDPLDGTSNYIHQFPMFAVSIGVLHEDRLGAGVIYDPLRNEMFSAVQGKGAYLNRRRIYSSKTKKLAQSLMSTGIPFRARNRFEQYFCSLKTISLASAGMRRGGSAALDLAYVACGRFDGFWEINLSPWDVAAGALLIHEAGGKVSDLWGSQNFLKNGDILASNGHIHEELKAITASIFKPKA